MSAYRKLRCISPRAYTIVDVFSGLIHGGGGLIYGGGLIHWGTNCARAHLSINLKTQKWLTFAIMVQWWQKSKNLLSNVWPISRTYFIHENDQIFTFFWLATTYSVCVGGGKISGTPRHDQDKWSLKSSRAYTNLCQSSSLSTRFFLYKKPVYKKLGLQRPKN